MKRGDTIKIAVNGRGLRRRVKALFVAGDWAVHRTAHNFAWLLPLRVTHIPTGRAVTSENNIGICKAVARALAADGRKWSHPATEAEKQAGSAIVRAAREAWLNKDLDARVMAIVAEPETEAPRP